MSRPRGVGSGVASALLVHPTVWCESGSALGGVYSGPVRCGRRGRHGWGDPPGRYGISTADGTCRSLHCHLGFRQAGQPTSQGHVRPSREGLAPRFWGWASLPARRHWFGPAGPPGAAAPGPRCLWGWGLGTQPRSGGGGGCRWSRPACGGSGDDLVHLTGGPLGFRPPVEACTPRGDLLQRPGPSAGTAAWLTFRVRPSPRCVNIWGSWHRPNNSPGSLGWRVGAFILFTLRTWVSIPMGPVVRPCRVGSLGHQEMPR